MKMKSLFEIRLSQYGLELLYDNVYCERETKRDRKTERKKNLLKLGHLCFISENTVKKTRNMCSEGKLGHIHILIYFEENFIVEFKQIFLEIPCIVIK